MKRGPDPKPRPPQPRDPDAVERRELFEERWADQRQGEELCSCKMPLPSTRCLGHSKCVRCAKWIQ